MNSSSWEAESALQPLRSEAWQTVIVPEEPLMMMKKKERQKKTVKRKERKKSWKKETWKNQEKETMMMMMMNWGLSRRSTCPGVGRNRLLWNEEYARTKKTCLKEVSWGVKSHRLPLSSSTCWDFLISKVLILVKAMRRRLQKRQGLNGRGKGMTSGGQWHWKEWKQQEKALSWVTFFLRSLQKDLFLNLLHCLQHCLQEERLVCHVN